MDNVLEDLIDKIKRIARSSAKRRWLALGIAAGTALACGVGIGALPDRFEASAKVYVDTQSVLKPLMAGLAYQPDIDEQVRMLARTLVSRPNVERLVSMPALQLDERGSGAHEEVVSRLMKQIKVVATSSGNLYEISYRGTSPERAQRLVEATVELFAHAGAGEKKRDSQDAGRFIEDQIRGYEAKLVESENRLKEFKVRNFGVSGVSPQDYFTRVSVLSEQVSKLKVELGAAERTRDSYRRELAAEEPNLPVDPSLKYGPGMVSEVETRLDGQRKVLDELLRRYTDAHPDVISARRIIAELEIEARRRREADDRATAGGGRMKAATSPVYQKLRIALAEAEAQVASLHSQLAAQQGQLEQVRAMAGRLPQVEAELAQLNRDYEILHKTYDQMVQRRESASLGVKLDESSQLAEFRVVEPARVSPWPVFPSRLQLALVAVVVSLVVGVAGAVLIDLMRPTFDETESLRLFSGRPILGTVSMLLTPDVERAHRSSLLRFGVAAGALMTLQAAWVGWIALTARVA